MSVDSHGNDERNKFYENLLQDVLTAVSVEDEEGAIREEKFTQIVMDMLAEAGETENARECRDIREDSIGRKIHKVNGYSLSENYETLDLFVTIFRGSDFPEKIYKEEIQAASNQCLKFLNNAIKKYADEIEESSPIFDLAQTLMRFVDELARVNVFILTDGIAIGEQPEDSDIRGILVNYYLRDIEYLWRLNSSKLKRLPIEIDFETKYGGPVPCLPVPSTNEDYESYLCILSGDTLASVYQAFGSRLLEQNVRSFLQFTGKINKGMRETIKVDPHMFLAFNNGIAATAESVELIDIPNGGKAIKLITDLQIVNGGQTTATIFHSKRKDGADVSKVFVQMKLSVIKNTENLSDIVSRISRYANTQNRVSEADLSSNHPFHIELEKLSRNIWAPAVSGVTHQSRWFYERARGQYRDELNRELTPKRRKIYEQKNPKAQKFVKKEMAKYHQSWEMKPWFVVRGNQKNYAEFMKNLKKTLPDSQWFEDIIAKAILFKRSEKIYGIKPNAIGDMRYITVPYTLAWLNHHTNGRIDLLKIWRQQGISREMEALLRSAMERIDQFIQKNAPGALYGEWAKKEECWQSVSVQSFGLDTGSISGDFVTANTQRLIKDSDEIKREFRQQQVSRIKSVSVPVWKAIIEWGRESDTLSSYQREIAYLVYKSIESKKALTDIQINNALKILDIAVEQKPELFFELDEVIEDRSAALQTEITLDTIRQIVFWDKTHRRLHDYEWNFMRDLAEGKRPMTEKSLFIARKNWVKVKKYGFRG